MVGKTECCDLHVDLTKDTFILNNLSKGGIFTSMQNTKLYIFIDFHDFHLQWICILVSDILNDVNDNLNIFTENVLTN